MQRQIFSCAACAPSARAHANFPPPVKRNFAISERGDTFLRFAADRATARIAPDAGRWYKVCAAIQETCKVRAIAGLHDDVSIRPGATPSSI